MAVILRDPLQCEQTPYELLGVGRDTNAKQIRSAFKLAVVRRRASPQQLQQAMKRLFDLRDRALTDALLYNSRAATDLGSDGARLKLAVRGETDRLWSQRLQEGFPDLPTMHNLAVLWYWWAVHETDRYSLLTEALAQHGVSIYRKTVKQGLLEDLAEAEGRDCKPSAGQDGCPDLDCPWRIDCSYESPSIDTLWSQAVAYWAPLLATHTFWCDHLNAEEGAAREARQDLEERLQAYLFDLRRRFEGASATRLANIVGDLEDQLPTELRGARLMARSALPLLGSGTEGVGVGRLLLEAVDQLQPVQRRVKRQQRLHATEELEQLQVYLTPHGHIAQLVVAKRWREALEQIEKLSGAEQNRPQVTRLAAEAHLGKGQQEAGLGNTEAALEAWKAALEYASDAALREKIETAVIQTCLERASILENRDPDRAIAILEQGDSLVSSRNLRTRLGALLFHQAVSTYNTVQERINRQGEVTSADVLELEQGLAALEWADALGFGRAADQLPTAREVLSDARGASEARKWSPWLKKANEAAGEDDWDTTIRYLRRALKEAGRDAPAFIEDNLATSLANRAIRKVNDLLGGGLDQVGVTKARRIAAQACEDLAEADRLKPGDSRIQTNRKQAEELRDQLTTAVDTPPWQTALQQANAAAGRDDWNGAVRHLRRAMDEAGHRPPASLKKNLAASLTNRAVSEVNRVMSRGLEKVGIGDAYRTIDKACDDLAEADRLDPLNPHVLTNKRQAEQLREQLEPLYDVFSSSARRPTGVTVRTRRSKRKSQQSPWMGVVSLVAGILALILILVAGTAMTGIASLVALVGVVAGLGGLIRKSGRGWAALGLVVSIAGVPLLNILLG